MSIKLLLFADLIGENYDCIAGFLSLGEVSILCLQSFGMSFCKLCPRSIQQWFLTGVLPETHLVGRLLNTWMQPQPWGFSCQVRAILKSTRADINVLPYLWIQASMIQGPFSAQYWCGVNMQQWQEGELGRERVDNPPPCGVQWGFQMAQLRA